MSWFIFALAAMLGWGFADLFYKKSTDETDRYSHLRIAVWVGLVMGLASGCLLIFSAKTYTFSTLIQNAIKYSPASLGYIVSMIVGYAGIRYLEMSIISPVQNASGALASGSVIIFFLISGKIRSIRDEFSLLDIFGTAAIVFGVIALAVAEKKNTEKTESPVNGGRRMGALALIFPISYCLFDTLGTAADGIILDEKTGLGLGEIDVLIIYGFTFAFAGVLSYLFLAFKTRKFYNPFAVSEIKTKGTAALFEEAGQIFYVYAMAANPVLAAPMIASYCIVTVVLSATVLKEKLKPIQYLLVGLVIFGIILLGISEGLSEA
ncbi:MAG: EamA family transporter [Clostridia bacterium]|nr:EamA family transporter [Clostridia bacterium]